VPPPVTSPISSGVKSWSAQRGLDRQKPLQVLGQGTSPADSAQVTPLGGKGQNGAQTHKLGRTACAVGARTLPAPIWEHRWNTSLERCGLLRTSTDSPFRRAPCIYRENAGSASQTRLTRNEGVPGSSPGVGFASVHTASRALCGPRARR
jgi:hypothetical protein